MKAIVDNCVRFDSWEDLIDQFISVGAVSPVPGMTNRALKSLWAGKFHLWLLKTGQIGKEDNTPGTSLTRLKFQECLSYYAQRDHDRILEIKEKYLPKIKAESPSLLTVPTDSEDIRSGKFRGYKILLWQWLEKNKKIDKSICGRLTNAHPENFKGRYLYSAFDKIFVRSDTEDYDLKVSAETGKKIKDHILYALSEVKRVAEAADKGEISRKADVEIQNVTSFI